jgi:hypothetical protein
MGDTFNFKIGDEIWLDSLYGAYRTTIHEASGGRYVVDAYNGGKIIFDDKELEASKAILATPRPEPKGFWAYLERWFED